MREETMSSTKFRKARRVAQVLDNDLKWYLQGGNITLTEIEARYGIDHKRLVSIIEEKAIESEEWRELYFNFRKTQRKSYKNVDFIPEIVDMIINERSVRRQAKLLDISYETFRDKVDLIKPEDRLFDYLKRHKTRMKEKRTLSYDEKEEIKKELLDYLENREEPQRKLSEEEYVEEAEKYLREINPETGKIFTKKEIAVKFGIAEATLRRYFSNVERRRNLRDSVSNLTPPPGGDDR